MITRLIFLKKVILVFSPKLLFFPPQETIKEATGQHDIVTFATDQAQVYCESYTAAGRPGNGVK